MHSHLYGYNRVIHGSTRFTSITRPHTLHFIESRRLWHRSFSLQECPKILHNKLVFAFVFVMISLPRINAAHLF